MKKLIIILLLCMLVFCSCTTISEKKELTSEVITTEETILEDDNQAYDYNLVIDSIVLDEELTLQGIAEGVIVVNHKFPWDANSMILEMRNGEVLMIDTPYENEATKQVIEWVKVKIGSDVKIVEINTGYHFDNIGGNGYLASQGIEIIGTSKSVEMIESHGEDARNIFINWLQADDMKKYREAYYDNEYVLPTIIIDMEIGQEYTLKFGDEHIILFYPDISHSPDNIVIYVPDRMLLFGGCMVKAGKAKTLGNTADADIEGWGRSIDKVVKKFPPSIVTYVVPGHGDTGEYELLYNTRELVDIELQK